MTRSGSAVEGLAWALYDFANTIFSFAIVSFAMSLWATSFLGETEGQRWFGIAVSVSVLVNAVVSPILGAMSDRTGRRKPFLLFFTILTIVPTALIGLVDIGLGLLAFALANFAYQAALIYYDALLPEVARGSTRGKLSGIGVGLGYLGTIVSGLLFRFTTDADGNSTAASFLLIASLFAIFAVPLFLIVRERGPAGEPFRAIDAVRSWSQLGTSIRHARETPGLLRFLVGRFFYTDPVNTAIVVMSAFAVFAVGFTQAEALNILLLLTVVAVIASFGWGWLNDRIGPKPTLLIVLATWAVGLLVLTATLEPIPFLVAGALLGAGLGGVGVTDRLLLLRLDAAGTDRRNPRRLRPRRQAQRRDRPGRLHEHRREPRAEPRRRRLPDRDRQPPRDPCRRRRVRHRCAPRPGSLRRSRGGGSHRAGDRAARRGDPMTIIVAHRGASAMAPENTMEAFRLGLEAGADAIELDVHLTADGELAVIHDGTLDRTTDRNGSVAALTMDEIREADAGARFARPDESGFPYAGRDLRVPALSEVLDWLPDTSGLVIEIKARAAADTVVAAVDGRPVRTDGRLSVISFDEVAIDRVRELDPAVRTGYLVAPGQPIDDALAWASGRGHAGVHPWERDLGDDPLALLANAKLLGLEVGCYVVNDPARMRFLADIGIWGFVTDVPDVAAEALGRS